MYLNGITNPNIQLPTLNNSTINPEENVEHVWHLFVIRHSKRNELQEYLAQKGIQTLIHYPIPPNKQAAYHEMNDIDFPITNEIHDTVLSLPLSPVLTNTEVATVIAALNSFN